MNGPDPLLPLLQKELDIGERLRWHGRPREGAIKWAAFGIWLFAIPWTAFALFWTYMAWSGVDTMADEEGPGGILKYAFPLFGVPFILIGLGMLLTPVLGLFSSSERIHGITDKRIITLTSARGVVRVKSLQARHIGPIERWEGKQGRGKVTIETHSTRDSEGERKTETVTLIGVENAARVEELVRALSRNADAQIA